MVMAQILDQLKVRAVNCSKTLLKIIKNPITDHIPADCLKVYLYSYLDRNIFKGKTCEAP